VIATDNGMRPPGVHLVPISDRDGCRRVIEQVLADPPPEQRPAETNADNVLAVVELYRGLLKSVS
jgi:hypothetical protein